MARQDTTRRFVPDATPDGMDPVQAEWILRQLYRLEQSLSIITTDQDAGFEGLADHIGDFTNPHQVTHSQLPDKGSYTHALIDGHINSTSNPHQVAHTQLTDMVANSVENPHGMMRWRGNWEAGSYLQHDVTLDGAWLMCANKDTTDRAAPQPIGSPDWIANILGGESFSSLTSATGVYISGNRFVFPFGGRVSGYRFYAPDISGNFNYALWADINNREVVQVVAPTIPSTVGWIEVPFSGVFVTGTEVILALVTRAEVTSDSFSSTWEVENKNGIPDENKAWFQSNATEIRVHNIDSNDTNQQTNLRSVEIGGTLSFAGSTWTIVDRSDSATHVRYYLEPNQGRPSENTYLLQFEWGSTNPIPYVRDPTLSSGSSNVEGFGGTVYPPTVYDPNAFFGTDIRVQEFTGSNDWDLMAYTGEADKED